MFEIVKNVPVPVTEAEIESRRKPLYPFDKMEVGDSFFVPAEAAKKAYNAVRVYKSRNLLCVKSRNGKAKPWDYLCRPEGDGIRIWRTV